VRQREAQRCRDPRAKEKDKCEQRL
jgi:hypothetical protein